MTWTWSGGNYSEHSVTFSNEGSGSKLTGTYQRTFSTAGTYNYSCTVHGASMSGTVIVQ